MNRVVRKKCNGTNKHENEFRFEDLLKTIPVSKGGSAGGGESFNLPNELVMKCRFCTEGRVVFTRSDIEQLK
jgi:hypothetical protein